MLVVPVGKFPDLVTEVCSHDTLAKYIAVIDLLDSDCTH